MYDVRFSQNFVCGSEMWSVVLVSEMTFCFRKCRFRLRNLRFGCGRAFGFGNLQFHFRNAVKLWSFAIWFHKMLFLSRKVVSVSESGLYFEI